MRSVLGVAAFALGVALIGCGGAPSETRPPEAVYLSASGIAFVQPNVEAPADAEFQLYFENRENVPHNVNIVKADGSSVAQGPVFSGPAGHVLEVPALAAGAYRLICDVHPETMRAQLVATTDF